MYHIFMIKYHRSKCNLSQESFIICSSMYPFKLMFFLIYSNIYHLFCFFKRATTIWLKLWRQF